MKPASPAEVMTIVAARLLRNKTVCFVGIGLPSGAANLARLTHAPDIVLVYESGVIDAKPGVLPLSIGDEELAQSSMTVVSAPELFGYWLQGGRIDVGFLGAAQVDKFANLNSTVIGQYSKPIVRLPGSGGAPEIAAHAKETLVIIEHDKRKLVDKVDFVSTAGYLSGGDARRRAGLRGGPSAVITDLAVLRPEQGTAELIVTQLHPGVTREQVVERTGWSVRFAIEVGLTASPTDHELTTLRELHEKTCLAHDASAERVDLGKLGGRTSIGRQQLF